MATPTTQMILAQLSQPLPAPKQMPIPNNDYSGLAKALLMSQTGQYDPNGPFTELGGKPGGYGSIDEMLGQASRPPGMFGLGR